MLTHKRLNFRKSLEADISPRMSSLQMNEMLQKKSTRQTDLGSTVFTSTAPESHRFQKLRTFPTTLMQVGRSKKLCKKSNFNTFR